MSIVATVIDLALAAVGGVAGLVALGWLAREALAELSLSVEARRYRRPLTDAERAARGIPAAPQPVSPAAELPAPALDGTPEGDGPGVLR